MLIRQAIPRQAILTDSNDPMKKLGVFNSFVLLCFYSFFFLGLSGCATLDRSIFASFMGSISDDSEEISQDELERDPIARVALHYRNESPSARARKAESEERYFAVMRRKEVITLGMPREEVLSIWGEPTEIQIAGDPSTRNEKWTYYEGLSSAYGLSTARDLYFEQGRVAGWENRVRQ